MHLSDNRSAHGVSHGSPISLLTNFSFNLLLLFLLVAHLLGFYTYKSSFKYKVCRAKEILAKCVRIGVINCDKKNLHHDQVSPF
jgi:hypothetical protein